MRVKISTQTHTSTYDEYSITLTEEEAALFDKVLSNSMGRPDLKAMYLTASSQDGYQSPRLAIAREKAL